MYQINREHLYQLDIEKIVEKLNKGYDVVIRKEDNHVTVLVEKRERKVLQKVSK